MEKIGQARNFIPSLAIADEKSKDIKVSKKFLGQKQNSLSIDINVHSKPHVIEASVLKIKREHLVIPSFQSPYQDSLQIKNYLLRRRICR